MKVARLSPPKEKNPAGEKIDDLLVTRPGPPLCRENIFAPRHYDPEAPVEPRLRDLRHPPFLLLREVNVTLQLGRQDGKVQPLLEILDEPVNKMMRRRVALMDERIMHVDRSDSRIALVQWRDV